MFFGWWMVALSGFVHSLNASAFNKGYTVFLLPVSEGLGVSRFAISLAQLPAGLSTVLEYQGVNTMMV